MNTFISLFLSGLIVNNLLFSKFLDIEQLFKISNEKKYIFGFSLSFIISGLFTSIISYFIYNLILFPNNLIYLQMLVFVFVSICVVGIIKFFADKYCSEKVDEYFKLILINNILIQVLVDNVLNEYNLISVIINSISVSLGFVFMIYVFVGIKDRLSFSNIPNSFKGLPILLIVCGLIALALNGLAGLV